jgi:glutamate-1-semialdehyde 2,1-aminomutase
MSRTWELRDYDRDFFEKELDSFIPARVFDAHAHLYDLSHWGPDSACLFDQGPALVDFEEYQRQIQWLTPGRKTSGLFFGAGLSEEWKTVSNEFVAREVVKDWDSRGLLIVSPKQDPEWVRQQVKKFGFVGLKVYHTFSERTPTWESEVADFLTEEHVRIAHEEGWLITLHMVRPRAMADSVNQEQIRYYCRRYPNIKMILAHGARGFNPHHTIEGVQALKGLHNVWCDTSAVTEAGGFEAIVETLGHDRLLWGSDFPISHLRGRCVAIGDAFLWLYEDTLDWDNVGSQGKIRPLLIGHESLRALKLAARTLHLSDARIEDIFCNNGRQMFEIS